MELPEFSDDPSKKKWTEPARVSKEVEKWFDEQLRAKAPTSERLCQVLSVKLAGCSSSINWCKPESLGLGNLHEGACFRLLNYAHFEPYELYLHIQKKSDEFWYSNVSSKR